MKYVDQKGYVWSDGELIPFNEAKVHILTHTLHYGIGVFEGLRTYKTDKGEAIFRLSEHMQRFIDSGRTLSIAIPYDLQVLCQAVITVVQKNKLENKYIRPLCYLDSDDPGIHAKLIPHVAVCTYSYKTLLGAEGLQRGVRIQTSSLQRINPQNSMVRAKAIGNYLNTLLANEEAIRCGYDGPLQLDHQGFIAEGSGVNFLMVKDGIVYSPHETNILPGITRDTIIGLCHDLNIPVKETNITRDQAYLADEVFFTGTAAEVTPVQEIDGRKIGEGCPGPITQQLQKLYFDTVHGRQTNYEKWLTYV